MKDSKDCSNTGSSPNIDVMDPRFYRSWEHLEALIDGLEEQNQTGPRPAGGQQCGMDKSWDLPYNRLSMKREINRYCKSLKAVVKALKEDVMKGI